MRVKPSKLRRQVKADLDGSGKPVDLKAIRRALQRRLNKKGK